MCNRTEKNISPIDWVDKVRQIADVTIDRMTFYIKRLCNQYKEFVKKQPEFKISIDKEKINVDKTKNSKFGDFTTNIVMTLNCGNVDKAEVAKKIASFINSPLFEKIDNAGQIQAGAKGITSNKFYGTSFAFCI